MTHPSPLYPDTFYHIYNRGINGENLFVEERNYRHFLEKYAHYIEPVAETYAYCLLRNHFHLLVRIRTEDEQLAYGTDLTGFGNLSGRRREPRHASRQFGNLFNAYAKAINKAYGRYGSLFCRPFKRIPVTSAPYFVRLTAYIHRNAQHHGFVEDFRDWPHSSYQTMLSAGQTRLQREVVLDWFEGRAAFLEAHVRDGEDLKVEITLEDE